MPKNLSTPPVEAPSKPCCIAETDNRTTNAFGQLPRGMNTDLQESGEEDECAEQHP